MFFHALAALGKHDHLIIDFEGGTRMVFNDTRRFGAIDLVKSEKLTEHKWISKLGSEPLSNNFTSKLLKQEIIHKKCSIKTAILDQRIVSGIGNIYSNEILFYCKINPNKRGFKINNRETET